MNRRDIYNHPGYKTRVSPTAVVIFPHADELYTILIRNKGMSHGYLFPNGVIESGEANIAGAIREFQEETGITTPLKHLGSLGALARQSGTQGKNEKEILILDMKPRGEKFLFIKEQIYELFTFDTIVDLTKLKQSIKLPHDIIGAQVIPLYTSITELSTGSDQYIAQILIKYLNHKNFDTIIDLLPTLQQEIKNQQDTIFH